MPSQKRRLSQLTCDKEKIVKQSESDRSSTQIPFGTIAVVYLFNKVKNKCRYNKKREAPVIQTSSRNAVNKKLFLTFLLFLARDVQHTNFRMSLKIKIVRQ
jgi:endo-1,4-beta-D-glucanase Y